MTSSLVLAPLIPWFALAALAAIGTVLVVWTAIHRGRGWPFRAAVILILLGALANPSIVGETRETQSDIALVLVDNSPSQQIGERLQTTEVAVAELRERLASRGLADVREISFGGDADDDGTRLGLSLTRALAEIPSERLSAVVIVSDGQVHDLGADTPTPAIGAPVHVLLTGSHDEHDRRIVIEQAPAYRLVGEDVAIRYRVDDLRGNPTDADRTAEPVTVRIRVDGREAGLQRVMPGTSTVYEMTIDHAGSTVIEIEADVADGELSAANNRAVVTIAGVRERLRTLLISGQPHPGERMWRNLLKSDPAVDLVHFTILRPPDKSDGARINELSLIAFPVEELFEEKLYDFDLIIFDRYTMRGVLPWRYLAKVIDYVETGGAVLLSIGPEFTEATSLFRTPLGPILPAAPTGRVFEMEFQPQVTEVGRRHPVTTDLPGESPMGDTDPRLTDVEPEWGRWYRTVEVTPRSGHTLMSGPQDLPLVLVDRVNEGRIAMITSDHLWLWARGYDGGGPHAELTRRLVHWLMQEPELEEERLVARVDDDRLQIERRSLSTDPVTVTVTDPTGAEELLELAAGSDGVARGEVQALQPGLYSVTDNAQTALAASGSLSSIEYSDVRATTERLTPLVEATGGSIRSLADGMPQVRSVRPSRDASGNGWIGFVRNEASLVTGVTRVALFPIVAVLALALAGLAAAWWREGR